MLLSSGASVFSLSMVAAGSLSNAAFVGANTVYWPLLRVSTRFTFGFSLPDNAEVRVVSIGLFDAAVATGSWAIPATDPGPLGCCAAEAEQPDPTRSAAGSAVADVVAVIAGAAMLVAGIALVVPWAAGLLLEHPEKPTTAIAARLATATDLTLTFIEFRFLCYRGSLLPPLPDKHELFGVTPVTDGSENRSLSVASEKLASEKLMRARRDRRAEAAQ